jgi:hypothetical protein
MFDDSSTTSCHRHLKFVMRNFNTTISSDLFDNAPYTFVLTPKKLKNLQTIPLTPHPIPPPHPINPIIILPSTVSFVVFGSIIWKLPFVPKIDPYPLKFFYNMSQMMLCAYMTVEAGEIEAGVGWGGMGCWRDKLAEPSLPSHLDRATLVKPRWLSKAGSSRAGRHTAPTPPYTRICVPLSLAGLVAYRNNYTIVPGNDFSTTSPAAGAVLYIFYLSKVWDFWDTIFIIVGKKWKQVRMVKIYMRHTLRRRYRG